MRGRRGLAALLPTTLLLLGAGTAPEPAGRWGVSVDDYPAEALRSGLQGTTRFDIAVNEAGKATGCTIVKSSGHAVLDQQACTVLMRRAKFKPARDDAGNPVAGSWRHLVVWTPSNSPAAAANPAFAGYGITVSFDGSGAVSGCKAVALSAISKVTPEQADKCRSIGTAEVFSTFLDRPTKGLATATYRVRSESRWAGAPLRSNEPVQRVLAHIEIDRATEGAITWCEVKVAPSKLLPGFSETDMCGSTAFGVSSTKGGGQPEHVIYDVVATR